MMPEAYPRGQWSLERPGVVQSPAVVREVTEYLNSFVPLGRFDERIETPRFTLCMGPGARWNTVQRQRFAAHEIDDVLTEVRQLLRARARESTQWEIGSTAQPPDLVELLLERGLVRDESSRAVALILQREPPRPRNEQLTARRIETFEEYVAAHEVQWTAFDTSIDQLPELRALLPERWTDQTSIMHGVWLNDEILAAGSCAPTAHGLALFGGATRPSARGRGAYRALIHARWKTAAAYGTAALMTQGGRMSRPILERLGFTAIGQIEVLLDEFDADLSDPASRATGRQSCGSVPT